MRVISTIESDGLGGTHDVAVKDSIAYACGYWDRCLYAIDISNPFKPYIVSCLKAWELIGIHDIAIFKDIAYVTNTHRDCVTSINISDPLNMKIMRKRGDGDLFDHVHALCTNGKYIYSGAHIRSYLNILDREVDLRIMNSIKLNHRPRGIFVRDSICFVSSPEGYLTIINVRYPKNPMSMSELKLCGDGPVNEVSYVKCLDNTAFVIMGKSQSIISIDISDLTKPKKLSEIKVERPNYIALGKDCAYITSHSDYRKVTKIDISDVSDLKVVDSIRHDSLQFAAGLAVYGKYILCSPRDSHSILTIIEDC